MSKNKLVSGGPRDGRKQSHSGSRATLSTRTKQYKRGYVSAADVTSSSGYNASTVHRWMDSKKLTGKTIAGRRWIALASVKEFLGEEIAQRIVEDLTEDGVR